MMLTDLGNACRATGLNVIEQSGWQTRGHGVMSGVRTIVCHHTAGPKTGDIPSLGIVLNGRPDLTGPLANLMLSRSGIVYVIAAGLAYHAGVVLNNDESNGYSVGIEAEATGVDPWSPQQFDAYARLTAGLARWYKLPVSRIMGHKEVCSPHGRKIDPNFDMNALRNLAAQYLAGSNPEEDDMFSDADRALLNLLAHKDDLGWARDQLAAGIGVDPKAPPEVLTSEQIVERAVARRVDVGFAKDQIMARLDALEATLLPAGAGDAPVDAPSADAPPVDASPNV